MVLSDDVIYMSVILLSIPAGHFVKSIPHGFQRQVVVSALGFFLVVLFCQSLIWHSILTIAVNYVIIRFVNYKVSHSVCFVWNFGYLAFFRTTEMLGLAPISPLSNALQLVLTLKMSGLAFEHHDTQVNKRRLDNMTLLDSNSEEVLRNKYQAIHISVFDTFCYGYSFLGIFTGPIYRFRTFKDMVDNPHATEVSVGAELINRLKWAPLAALGFLAVSQFFSLQYVKTDEFQNEPFWYRLFYMVPMFFIFRTRFYVAWMIAEAMCVAAVLGAYPTQSKPQCWSGPTDFQALRSALEKPAQSSYSFATIDNINVWGCELAPTVREGLKSWNTTVQSWLAANVYRRCPVRAYRVTLTMAVSAWWHGMHPGYYLSFLTVPLCVEVEDRMKRIVHKSDLSSQQRFAFDVVNWFLKMRAFDYMCMGFILLRFDLTMRYWSSIYFVLHILLGMLLIMTLFFSFDGHKDRAKKES